MLRTTKGWLNAAAAVAAIAAGMLALEARAAGPGPET
jgi:hypothetical protein